MAVIHVGQQPPREGEAVYQRNNLLYSVLGRKYQVTFYVKTDNHKDGSNVVLKASAAGVPQVGDVYSFGNDDDEVAVCESVKAYATGNRRIWKVVAQYDTDIIVAAITDNPLNQPPELSWTDADYEKPMIRDLYGVPLVSSSKSAFDSPYMQSLNRRVLTIVRNEPGFDSDLQRDYRRTLNKEIFCEQAKFQARIESITGSRRLVNGILHYQVTYQIEFRDPPDSFHCFILDADWRDADGNLFRDKRDASPLSNQTPLNGRGRSLHTAKSTLGADINNAVTTLTVADWIKFPPAYKAANADGINPGPNWYFQIKIDDEIMEVTSGADTSAFTVTRGFAGTTAAAHTAGAEVSLEPYYLRFIENKPKDWTPLDLPVI